MEKMLKFSGYTLLLKFPLFFINTKTRRSSHLLQGTDQLRLVYYSSISTIKGVIWGRKTGLCICSATVPNQQTHI